MNTEYTRMVRALAKPGKEILESMTPEKCHTLHMAVGVAGEAGELLDAVKKHVIYNKPLDTENVIEEIGDKLFYITGLLDGLGLTIEQCMAANMAKLGIRYSGGSYSDQAAQNRADKA
jgi:NTP pyrophosphatase (non-canonical NTP hydrolase)